MSENGIGNSSVKTSTKINIVIISNLTITFFGFISLVFIKKYLGFQALGMIAFATSYVTIFSTLSGFRS